MLIDLLDCISDSHKGGDGTWHVAADKKEAPVDIDFDDKLVLDGRILVT